MDYSFKTQTDHQDKYMSCKHNPNSYTNFNHKLIIPTLSLKHQLPAQTNIMIEEGKGTYKTYKFMVYDIKLTKPKIKKSSRANP